MFISEEREVLQHMLEINKAVKYFESNSAENKIKCTLNCHVLPFKVRKEKQQLFWEQFCKGPRIVSPFPHFPSEKDW